MLLPGLRQGARAFGVELDDTQLDAFDVYYRELVDWNQRVNLTSMTEPHEVVVKHLLDSLSIALALPLQPDLAVVDIGSGAGFPGLALRIAFPKLQVTLLDATRKKIAFLNHVISLLSLPGATAVQARAEDLAHDPAHRERYDLAVARAVAELAPLVELALPFVRVGGLFVAQKGIAVEEEVAHAARALELLGGRVHAVLPVQLPGLEPRHLVVIAKVASTPPKFPRRAGVPERKPL